MVMHTLSSEFTLLRVVNGETVAAHNLGVTNGFVKPKLGTKTSPVGQCEMAKQSACKSHSDNQKMFAHSSLKYKVQKKSMLSVNRLHPLCL